MKRLNRLFFILIFFVTVLSFSGCSRGADAGVLLREAKSSSESIQSCAAEYQQNLVFTANGAQHVISSSNQIIYEAEPFALKSMQKIQTDGSNSSSETYTMTEGGKLYFYCKPNGVWQKTDAGNLDTSPPAQVDILRVLNNSEDEKYVRKTTLDSQSVHKVELKLSHEILRSTLERIVTVTGLSHDSNTIVQTLLNSAPDLYGYCYIGTDTGKIVRVEADLTDAVNQIFQNIDGSSVSVHVTSCKISGSISSVDSESVVSLPEDARNASSVQAYG